MFRSLPDHLFISSCDGGLYDTRKEGWAAGLPLRRRYCSIFRTIKNNHQLKATLRAGQYAWPGGYQMYMVDANGLLLSFAGVEEQFKRLKGVSGSFKFPLIVCINYEEADLYCDITGELIPATYSE